MKKIIKWGLIGFAGLIVLGIVFGGDSGSPTKVGESEGQPEQEEVTQTEFKIGDQIAIEGRVLTVNSVKRNYVEPSSYPYTPEKGKEFILVNVTIENKSTSPINFGMYDFKLESLSGVRRDVTYVGTVANELDWGDLAAGGKVTGNMAFEVTKGESDLKLLFNPSFWSNKDVLIKL